MKTALSIVFLLIIITASNIKGATGPAGFTDSLVAFRRVRSIWPGTWEPASIQVTAR